MPRFALLIIFSYVMLVAVPAQAAPRVHDGFYMQLAVGVGFYNTSGSLAGFDESFSGLTIPNSSTSR